MNVKRQRSFVTFQTLILLSYFEIFKKRDVSYGTVDRTIEHIAEKRDRQRLFNSVRWINDVIIDLINYDWTSYQITKLFFIDVFFELLTCEIEFISFSDALSLINLIYIYNNENLKSILIYFKADEFVKHNYNDCLKLEYIIFNLITSLFNTCIMTIDKLLYEFRFDCKNNSDKKETKLIKFASLLITIQIMCRSSSKVHTEFILFLKASSLLRMSLISRSWYQVLFKVITSFWLQIRSTKFN